MAEKPILFYTDMVKAILDGRKTVTRRVIRPQPEVFDNAGYPDYADLKPQYQKGDLLWVKETYCHGIEWDDCKPSEVDPLCGGNDIWYFADGERPTDGWGKKRTSRFMTKWVARTWLKVLDNRAERLQDISLKDCYAEGIESQFSAKYKNKENIPIMPLKKRFTRLWDSLNAKPKPIYLTIEGKKQIIEYVSYPWEDIQEEREYRGKIWHVRGNPWVWRYEFKVR